MLTTLYMSKISAGAYSAGVVNSARALINFCSQQ